MHHLIKIVKQMTYGDGEHLSKKYIYIPSKVTFMEYAEIDANVITESRGLIKKLSGLSIQHKVMNQKIMLRKKDAQQPTFQQLLFDKVYKTP